MNIRFYQHIFAFLLLLQALTSFADTPATEAQPFNLTSVTTILEDSEGNVTCNNLLEPEQTKRFLPAKGDTLVLNNKHAVYWLRIDVAKALADQDQFYIYLPYRPVDELSFVYPWNGQNCAYKKVGVLAEDRTTARKYIHYRFFFKRDPVYTDEPLYLRVDNRSETIANSLPIYLFDTDLYFHKDLQLDLTMAAYYSVMAGLLLFNFFIFLRVRERSYFYYTGYLLLTFLVSIFLDGSYYTAFDKQAGPSSYRLFLIATLLQNVLHLLFVKRMLYGTYKNKFADKVCLILLNTAAALVFVQMLAPIGYFNSAVSIAYTTVIAATLLSMAFAASLKRLPYGRTLLLSLTMHFVLRFINALYLNGNLSDNIFAPWMGHIAYITEALLFSMVLASQFIQLRAQAILADQNQLVAHALAEKEKYENLEKTHFLARASHDLRQPLHSLSLYTAALNLKTTDDELRAIIKQMRLSIFAMQEMFSDILDISRLETNILVPHIEIFPVRDVLMAIENEASVLSAEKNLELVVMANCKWRVKTDQMFLKRILRNFVDNAIRYTPAGKILVGCRYQHTHLRIDIIDTGIGIGSNNHQEIFNEFFRCGEATNQQGLGLGLAIVKRLADRLGHTIEVRSTLGRGSRFSITLPLIDSKDVAVPVDESVPENFTQDLKGTTLVVIDDEASIRESLTLFLEARGCTVISGADSAQVIQQIEVRHLMPDLLLVDYHLHRHTGLEAIQMLHDYFGDNTIPVILITGNTSIENLAQLHAKGFRTLSKPVDPSQLELEILEKLSGR